MVVQKRVAPICIISEAYCSQCVAQETRSFWLDCRWFGKLGNLFARIVFLCLAKNLFAASKNKSNVCSKTKFLEINCWFGKLAKS